VVAFEGHLVSGKVEEQAIVFGRWLEFFWQPLGEQVLKFFQCGLAIGSIRD